ncbi:MAG: phosphoglucomutase, alpha-D-glucose phosphate-specific [Pseudomonadota bacterium]
MKLHEFAGKQVPQSLLTDIPRLVASYYTVDIKGPVSFGTSGHRGCSFKGTFNEMHIAATAQAICEYRSRSTITGPLFLGFDTHALSEAAYRTSLTVFAANDVDVIVHSGDEYTPTPVISFMILEHNKNRTMDLADGVVITPSHNPPTDGGIKYNPPSGGPADEDVTAWIQKRANQLMEDEKQGIRQVSYEAARRKLAARELDFITPFAEALARVVDMDLIRNAGIRIGVDPMGGAGVHFWEPIADRYHLNMSMVNTHVDPTFGFMPADWDGKIRMDCSSVHAMAKLIALADRFDIAWGNDPDFDRHGIVTPRGLMNPNHYLSVSIWYLLQNRPRWKKELMIGKTLVSSSMIDRVTQGLHRKVFEVPVGFKWFVRGLMDGSVAFGGEESAGASFLRRDGSVWTTDKDGFCMTLLAAEILAKTGKAPDEIYRDVLVPEHGNPHYLRIDSPITDQQKLLLKQLDPDSLKGAALAGRHVASAITRAPGNNAAMGGVKVTLDDGSWFAVRPSGTEPIMKFYIESFGGQELVSTIHVEAMGLIFG